MALQLQGLCTTSFSYSSSQFLATNLNSSHNCFRTASFKLAHHRMKNYRHICSESRSVPFSKRGIRRREAATERTSSGSHESTSTSPSTGGFQSLEMGNSQPNLGFKERENISQNPRPIHHRIPNFVGAVAAAQMLASLQAFATARCVKVNPDTPRKQVRVGGKKLLTPQPRLRTGFFSILDATMLPQGAIHEACTSAGVAMHGKPIGLDATLKVDLIVIGSVAVDPRTGARLRKGEGFAELEYGILRFMGAIDDSTLIVTSVHDKQLVDDIPVEKLLIHDVPVDVICTPTQIIHSNTTIPKPQGIYWDRLSPEKLGQIQILRELKKYIEKKTGQILPFGLSEKLPPTAERRSRRQGL